MLLLGGSAGCFNFTRLYFSLIVLSLSTENVPFLLPDVLLVDFIVFFFFFVRRVQWIIKNNNPLSLIQVETTSDAASFRWLFYYIDVCCTRVQSYKIYTAPSKCVP